MFPPPACAPRAQALGPDVELMVDAHGTYTVADAKRFVHLVARSATWPGSRSR